MKQFRKDRNGSQKFCFRSAGKAENSRPVVSGTAAEHPCHHESAHGKAHGARNRLKPRSSTKDPMLLTSWNGQTSLIILLYKKYLQVKCSLVKTNDIDPIQLWSWTLFALHISVYFSRNAKIGFVCWFQFSFSLDSAWLCDLRSLQTSCFCEMETLLFVHRSSCALLPRSFGCGCKAGSFDAATQLFQA